MKFPNQKGIQKGFTLIEMLVAVFVFSIIMTIATGAIFSIVSANKTSQALKSVMDNLSSAVDTMSREIRYGENYNCVDSSPTLNDPASCSTAGSSFIRFVNKDGQRVIYTFTDEFDGNNEEALYRCIERVSDDCFRMTAEEVDIDNLRFYVSGASLDEPDHPKVLITISGKAKHRSSVAPFDLQTMVSQRTLSMCKDVVDNIYQEAVGDCN
jgi:prepilin-type N-terminal cleavage/methylation domain-containing protein